MIRTVLVALVAALSFSTTACAQNQGKTLMAVFAHPDDEGLVGPVLAKYKREGANVILVTATDGREGTNDFSGYEAGDELAALRREELKCAANTLGIDLVHLTYYDQFNSAEGYDGFIPQLQGLLRDLKDLVEEHQPDAIVTFGPDGVSNHMDHRLVGSSVEQVFVSQNWEKTPKLYYFAFPASSMSEEDRVLRGVQEKYLTVRIPYTDADGEKALNAWACHASQFPPGAMESMRERFMSGENVIHFRPFVAPSGMTDDLFE